MYVLAAELGSPDLLPVTLPLTAGLSCPSRSFLRCNCSSLFLHSIHQRYPCSLVASIKPLAMLTLRLSRLLALPSLSSIPSRHPCDTRDSLDVAEGITPSPLSHLSLLPLSYSLESAAPPPPYSHKARGAHTTPLLLPRLLLEPLVPQPFVVLILNIQYHDFSWYCMSDATYRTSISY
jgi:hypothetical protein